MALRSSIYAMALEVQADAETRATIVNGDDIFPVANLRPGGQTFTVANPESTGSFHRPGDQVLGREANDTFDIIMRGPTGSAPPAAGDWCPGKVLRAAGFAETSEDTGVAAEALGDTTDNSGALTIVTLGSSASSVDGAYVGYTIQFSDIGGGSGVDSTSQIIAYDGTSKEATLGEKLSSAPAANYSIPPQLVYRLDADAAQLYLTHQFWLDGKLFKRQHAAVSQLQFNLPTSNRGNSSLPLLNVGLQAEIDDDDDETDQATPTVSAGGAVAPFRNGKLILNGVAVGGASVAYNHGIQVGFPPNPNKPAGADAGQIVETRRSVALNLNEVLLSEQDRSALAVAQSEIPLMLQYGTVAGRTVYFCVPAGRLDFANPDNGGEFVTEQRNLLIDGADNAVAFSFPYFT